MDAEKETGKRETEKRVKDRQEREWPRKNIEYNVSSVEKLKPYYIVR